MTGEGLDADEARRFYDRLGRWQDSQRFYEAVAVDALLGVLDLGRARSIVELGCGTGRVAAQMLGAHAAAATRYIGVDISPKMVAIATDRLRPHAARAEARVAPDPSTIPAPDDSADRFVSTYVFDLLSRPRREAMLAEAARVLAPAGIAGFVNLSFGEQGLSRSVSRLWLSLWRRWPKAVGGCRPIDLVPSLTDTGWTVAHRQKLTAWGITSEVVLATPRRPTDRGGHHNSDRVTLG
ncbi:MAG: class I SAM-dependent methyltransferase [Acidimicrobiia bacterium]